MQLFVWPGITFSWQAQRFRQAQWKNRKTHWHEAVSAALNFACLKEVSQNCFVFDVVKFKNWRSLAELLCFGCCHTRHRLVRGLEAYRLTLIYADPSCYCNVLSNLKNEGVSQNCFVFDVVKFKHWGRLAGLLRFWHCQVQNLRTSRRIASFSSLQIDR